MNSSLIDERWLFFHSACLPFGLSDTLEEGQTSSPKDPPHVYHTIFNQKVVGYPP